MICTKCETKFSIPIPLGRVGRTANVVKCPNCSLMYLPTETSLRKFKVLSVLVTITLLIILILANKTIPFNSYNSVALSPKLQRFIFFVIGLAPISISNKIIANKTIQLESIDCLYL